MITSFFKKKPEGEEAVAEAVPAKRQKADVSDPAAGDVENDAENSVSTPSEPTAVAKGKRCERERK